MGRLLQNSLLHGYSTDNHSKKTAFSPGQAIQACTNVIPHIGIAVHLIGPCTSYMVVHLIWAVHLVYDGASHRAVHLVYGGASHRAMHLVYGGASHMGRASRIWSCLSYMVVHLIWGRASYMGLFGSYGEIILPVV